MVNFRAELAALVAAYDEHGGRWPENDVEALEQAVEHARAVLAQPEPAPVADGQVIEGQLISGWLPIDSAPRDGTEILASDYDAIEIVSWGERQAWQGWSDREGRMMLPSWWQPLPEHPSLPEVNND